MLFRSHEPPSNSQQQAQISLHDSFPLISNEESFVNAIKMIPIHEKTGYLTALQRCPDLIQKESDPYLFINFEKNNLVAAATRLVKYWEWRTVLFDEFAYFPLLEINIHLCNTEFKSLLDNNAIFLLPETDEEKNLLAYFDVSRLCKSKNVLTPKDLCQVVFYTWTIAFNVLHQLKQHKEHDNGAQQRSAFQFNEQGRGIYDDVGITLIKLIHIEMLDDQFTINLAAIWKEAFPIRTQYMHAVFMSTDLAQSLAPHGIQKLNQAFSSFLPVIPHFGANSNESNIATNLAMYGITNAYALPITIGGQKSVFPTSYKEVLSLFLTEGILE